MQEEQEAIRYIVQVGRFATAPARDLCLHLARLMSHGLFDAALKPARVVGSRIAEFADVRWSAIDGHGSYGCVTYQHLLRQTKGQPHLWEKLPEEATRDDIKALADECRKHRLSFAVLEDEQGEKSLWFAGRDQEAVKFALQKVLGSYLTEGELQEAARDTPPPSPDEPVEPKPYEFAGEVWNPVPTPPDKPGVLAYAAECTDDQGHRMVKLACSDGTWHVSALAEDGTAVQVGSGTSDRLTGQSLEGAMSCANLAAAERYRYDEYMKEVADAVHGHAETVDEHTRASQQAQGRRQQRGSRAQRQKRSERQ